MVVDHEVRARPLVPIVDRVAVPFHAADGGVDELSWGQQELWLAMRRRRTWIPLGTSRPLPPGTSLDQVTELLRSLLIRYPTLRTRLRLGPERTRQVVADADEVPLEIGEAATDADPAAVAARLSLQYMDQDFHFERDWPIRMAVVRHRGALTHRVMVLCHLAIDGTGATRLATELALWNPAAGTPAVPPPAMPPLEQARRQRLPAARRQSEAALRHWESILRTAPPLAFAGLGEPRRPRYWKGSLISAAVGAAVEQISARTRTDSSAVFLALYAVVLARLLAASPVPVQVMVSNRFRPGLAETVSPVSQAGLCAVDVADLTVDQAVQAARRDVLTTYKHAYYDPLRREELVARIRHERGVRPPLECWFNDRRQPTTTGRAGDGTAAGGDSGSGRFDWVTVEDIEFTEPVYLYVESAGEADHVALTISADSHYLAPERMERLVRDLEALAVAAARDPATPTGVSRAG